MPKFRLMLSVAPAILVAAVASPALAQSAAPSAEPQAAQGEDNTGDIIVTATRRSEALSDVPLAISAVTAASLQNSGASDIRQLNQLSPSLLVSSTSSEAAAGGARIRGIGTVGDNPGLESSVATFIDGVYRSRAGVGLTELGAIDRIEVLRGPQGTLFGRNASAGLISVITAKPSFNFGAEGEATYGNYNQFRLSGGITGPISSTVAARLDGVYSKRDGFLRDIVSGRGINNRDRWLLRGQVLFQPSDDLSFRLIGDYADRREECCGATYLPGQDVTANADGTFNVLANSIAAIERGLVSVAPGANGRTGFVPDTTYARQIAITPGVDYRGNVKDWGISGELNYKFGDTTLTSITAYRDWRLVRGQDADYTNLDILRRLSTDAGGGQRQSFQTFTQELRLQGSAFGDKLDWLIGGYYANEILRLRDNLSYGADYENYANCLTAFNFATTFTPGAVPGAANSLVNPTVPGCLNAAVVPGVTAALTAGGAAAAPTLGLFRLFSGQTIPGLNGYRAIAAAGGIPTATLNGSGLDDTYKQTSRNFAFFTHNVIRFTDTFNLTLGARYTNERKTLDATFTDVGGAYCRAVPTSATLAAVATLPCVIPATPTGTLTQNGRVRAEERLTGTAVVSFKPAPGHLAYASYSRGYKAGGFNLDRSGLQRIVLGPAAVAGGNAPVAGIATTADTLQLGFEPEIVDAFELGYKLNRPGFDLNIAAFYQKFRGFQLNTFNGLNFIVVNVNDCGTSLSGAAGDNSNTSGACTGNLKSGVTSKGVELEAFIRPARYVSVNLGLTFADTKYAENLVGQGGTALPAVLSNLPGQRLSNSSAIVSTGAFTWTPPLGSSGLSGLLYADYRYQSALNSGSDLDREKVQQGVIVFNARIGIRGADQRWGLEFWAQNLLDQDFQQVSFDAPLQGGGIPSSSPVSAGVNNVQRGYINRSTQLYGAFLAEPRTYGVTARFKF